MPIPAFVCLKKAYKASSVPLVRCRKSTSKQLKFQLTSLMIYNTTFILFLVY